MMKPCALKEARGFVVVKHTSYSVYICYMATATIDDCFKLLKYRSNKAGYLGYISPNDFNLLWPRAERRYFNSEYDKYNSNQKHTESLIPFKTDPLPITVDAAGKYTLPTDVLHIDSIRSTYLSIQRPVVRVEDDRLAEHLSSAYDAPVAQFPIYTQYKTYLQFNPINIGAATLVYLQNLASSFWNYTLVSGRATYSVSGSVQPKWNDVDIDKIIYLIGDDIGINMRDQQLEAFSARKTQNTI